jgi:hypothetical protein
MGNKYKKINIPGGAGTSVVSLFAGKMKNQIADQKKN